MLVTLILVLLTVLASPGLAAAGDLWIPDLCVAQNFGGSGFVVSDFRATSSGCSFQFEDALRGTVSTQVSQWLLGFKLDLSLLSKLVETFGAKSKTSEGLEVRGAIPSSTPSTRHSFFMKASRKRVLLGFTLEW